MFNELPEDKRPPRNLWDKPYKLKLFLDEIFDNKKTSTKYVDYNPDEIE